MANYDRKDRLYQQAKEEGYRSRAAYKLIELNNSLKLLRPGFKVLDLGSFPGGWLQVAAQAVGKTGLVVGVDLRPVEPFSKQELQRVPLPTMPLVVEGDATVRETGEKLLALAGSRFDVVLSDLSPALTGVGPQDNARTAELLEFAIGSAAAFLRKNGAFVAKTFPCEETEQVIRASKKLFTKLERTKLKSSRKTSNELYVIGKAYR